MTHNQICRLGYQHFYSEGVGIYGPRDACCGFGLVCGISFYIKLAATKGDDIMKTSINIRKVIRDSVRLYFAPLTGAYKAVRREVHRINREQHKEIDNSRNKAVAPH